MPAQAGQLAAYQHMAERSMPRSMTPVRVERPARRLSTYRPSTVAPAVPRSAGTTRTGVILAIVVLAGATALAAPKVLPKLGANDRQDVTKVVDLASVAAADTAGETPPVVGQESITEEQQPEQPTAKEQLSADPADEEPVNDSERAETTDESEEVDNTPEEESDERERDETAAASTQAVARAKKVSKPRRAARRSPTRRAKRRSETNVATKRSPRKASPRGGSFASLKKSRTKSSAASALLPSQR